MSERIVYLMRGLPACGKSYTARRLAGATGVILETDQYFYLQVGDDPASYDYSEERLPAARQWNFNRFRRAIAAGMGPIIVDRGNGLNEETYQYARLAVESGYRVEIQEPDSLWWQELRVLLKYQTHLNPAVLDHWAEVLEEKSRESHRVPRSTIRRWMSRWRWDVTVEDILRFGDELASDLAALP